MNVPKLLVDSLFWTVILQLYLFLIDVNGDINFKLQAYGIFGFVLLYGYMVMVVALTRIGELGKKENK